MLLIYTVVFIAWHSRCIAHTRVPRSTHGLSATIFPSTFHSYTPSKSYDRPMKTCLATWHHFVSPFQRLSRTQAEGRTKGGSRAGRAAALAVGELGGAALSLAAGKRRRAPRFRSGRASWPGSPCRLGCYRGPSSCPTRQPGPTLRHRRPNPSL